MKKYFIVSAVVVVLAVSAAVWFVLNFSAAKDPAGPSPYSAVYMISGDIYYGKLSWFPRPHLTNVWFLQRGVDQKSGQAQFGLNRFTTAFWGPVDEMYLNPDQILFWTPLRNDSQVAQAFANPSLLQSQSQPGQGVPGPAAGQQAGGAPQGGFRGPTQPPPSQR